MKYSIGLVLLPVFMMLPTASTVNAAGTVTLGRGENNVTVISNDENGCVLDLHIANFINSEVNISGVTYSIPGLPEGSPVKEKGYPELPKIARSIIIPGNRDVTAEVIEREFVEFRMKVAPSKGILSRCVNPADIDYVFGKVYGENLFYPKKQVDIGTPYLIRKIRGIRVDLFPFSYNPYTGILRIFTHLKIAVTFGGVNMKNTSDQGENTSNNYFEPILRHHFINYDKTLGARDLPGEEGRMLVIAYDDFLDEMSPFVAHKNAAGLITEMVGLQSVGSTANAVDDYIQNYYNAHSDLCFVLLVGDYAQMPTPFVSGGGSDPSYSLVSGSDNYPDIIIGRFSAENSNQVVTMVNRSINYEKDESWFDNGMGIASSQGTGDDDEYDYEHVRNIRADLLDWHYTDVGEYYDGSQGGADAAGNPTPSMIAAGCNSGVSIINYCGHGSMTSWGTSGFSNSNVNALVNDSHLPFIVSVACVVGDFTDGTCFAEAWLRAENSATGNPTGAVGFYGSSINQSWSPPMEAQDEFNRLLVLEENATFGALCYNGSISMINDYGSGGENMFLTWHIFGDPSINVQPGGEEPPVNIRVEYMTTTTELLARVPTVNIRIHNDGTGNVNLSRVAVRYFYQFEWWAQSETSWVALAKHTPSGTDITTNTHTGIDNGSGFDRTLTVSFDNDAGVLQPGEYAECSICFRKTDNSYYFQLNDYSFGAVIEFTPWEKCPAFVDGDLVWGTAR